MIPKKGTKAANALKKAYEKMWHDDHSPITWRNPMEIETPTDSRLPSMGHGEEMLAYCTANSKVYPTLVVRRSLFNSECLVIAQKWVEHEKQQKHAVVESSAFNRNRLRAYDAMIAWYCLIQNMSYRKREELFGILATEAAARSEKGTATSDQEPIFNN